MERPEYERMYQVEDSHWWFVGRRQLAVTLLDRWITGKQRPRLLDIGCGTGIFCEMAANRGARVSGLDASEHLLAIARERVPVLVVGRRHGILRCASILTGKTWFAEFEWTT